MASLINGNRGGKVLIYEGYKYQKNKEYNQKVFWRCWRRTCRATLHTNTFDLDGPRDIVVFHSEPHNHEEDRDIINGQVITNRIKDNLHRDPTKPIKRVYDEVVSQANINENDVLEFNSIRSQLNRQRCQVQPPIPRTVEDINIRGEWARTWSGRDFLIHTDNDWGILVFATDKGLKCLQRSETVFIDGTFKTCPRPYVQFVTIHGLYRRRALPFVFALMTGKHVGQY